MKNPDLSVIVPSINPDRWKGLYAGIANSVGDSYTFELVCVGPKFPPSEMEIVSNFKYLRELSCPSRSFQLGLYISEGKYVGFCPDDVTFDKDGFKKCLDFMQDKNEKDGMTLRYSEGGQRQDEENDYWRARHHADQRVAGVKEDYRIAPCPLFNREFFSKLGGLDCRYNHTNLNFHAACYKIQSLGGIIHPSPTRVFQASWSPPTDATLLYQVYLQNDAPLFRSEWGDVNATEKYSVDFENWRSQPYIWPRRYKTS